ncbi:MAG: hypothetical protein HKN88_03805 [Gammaproteobacteria bacterium]|nr:hypothetical protein [Gammaproteobacteria bacterium]NNC97178.1 hypothetical protein [Gammaproteobacteria bacterium]NNM13629.1 hypothetical protein [Gammaproteobacteria bacterium]
MSNQSLEVTLKILDYFKENPDARVRPLSLSNEIDADPIIIDRVLSKYYKFFLYLPTEKQYKLNRSGKFKGDVVTMKIHAEELVKEKNFFQKYWYYITLTGLLIATYLLLYFLDG